MIPELNIGFDPGHVQSGPHAGKLSHYRDALYSCLVQLKPRVCLEIGTNYGASAAVFLRYFDDFKVENALLITTDIKHYTKIEDPRVIQVQVRPYVKNSTLLHYVKEEELRQMEELPIDNMRANRADISDALASRGEIMFDFSFVDGDHQRLSVYADLEIARTLSKKPHFILFDNVEDTAHDSVAVYHEELKTDRSLNTYDFSDWNRFVEAALIWDKDENSSSRNASFRSQCGS